MSPPPLPAFPPLARIVFLSFFIIISCVFSIYCHLPLPLTFYLFCMICGFIPLGFPLRSPFLWPAVPPWSNSSAPRPFFGSVYPLPSPMTRSSRPSPTVCPPLSQFCFPLKALVVSLDDFPSFLWPRCSFLSTMTEPVPPPPPP